MEIIFLYTLPMLISFGLMNQCYKQDKFSDPSLTAILCLIPIVNWICVIVYINKLWN